MSTELTSPRHPEWLLTIDDELSGMARRLCVITSESNSLQETLSEIATIYSNVAYIFVYLEGNERHLDYGPLLRHRDTFFKNPGLYASILHLMSRLNCPAPEAEEVRRTWMAWFQERAQAKDQDIDEKLEEVQQSAKHVLYKIQEDQAKLLERLGVNTGIASPSAVFYRIVSDTKNWTRDASLPRLGTSSETAGQMSWPTSWTRLSKFADCRPKRRGSTLFWNKRLSGAVFPNPMRMRS